MAGERYARTNQKLYFAGLSLAGWRDAEERRAINAQALVQAGRESALFHLHGAVLAMCHEIAGYYRLPQAEAVSLDVLLDRAQESVPAPELAELIELAGRPQSWLAQLLRAHAALFQPFRPAPTAKVDPARPLIQAVSLDAVEPALSREELEDWRQHLQALALRFRESLSEC